MKGNIPAESQWEIARLGKFTGSRMGDLLTQPKTKAAKEAGELSQTALSYILEKVTEIATGTTRSFSNDATEWGNENEPHAALQIKLRHKDFVYLGKETQEFFSYDDYSGGSPDGYCPTDKIVAEIKCPENPANHTKYLLIKDGEDLKSTCPEYYYQLQFNMMCVAKKLGCDYMEMKGLFVSYCPLFNADFEHLQYKEVEILPDAQFKEDVTAALDKAEKYMAELYSDMLNMAKVLEFTPDTVNEQSILITGDN